MKKTRQRFIPNMDINPENLHGLQMSCDNRGNVLELNNHKKVLTILEQKIGHFSIFSLENVTKLLV